MNNESKTVGVLGAGTMGSGIAAVMARAGHRTILYDIDEAGLDRGVGTVRGFFDKSVRLGKLDAAAGQAAKDALTGTTDLTDLAPCDVVVEAVFAYPGFGRMLLEASLFGDISLIEAATLIALVAAMITQLLSDLGYMLLNPQIRLS